jgi:hypothetical protein
LVGGALHQGPTSYTGHQYWFNTNDPPIPFDFATQSLTLIATVQIISSTFNAHPPRGGYNLCIDDALQRTFCVDLTSNSVLLRNSSLDVPDVSRSFDTTDAFHTYRLVADSSGGRLFVDGSASPFLTIALGVPDVNVLANKVFFGDATAAGSNESLTKDIVAGVVPEPSSIIVCGIGGLVLAGYGWCRRRST